MIFVTVGGQMPFDRFIRRIDLWAGQRQRNDIFAQIGATDFRPGHMPWARFLNADDYKQRCLASSVIVAHAGTGSIITALQLGKPIIIMPRHASLRETRNDHQIATAKRFACFESVLVAHDEDELVARLDAVESLSEHQGSQAIAPQASPELIQAIRDFIGQA